MLICLVIAGRTQSVHLLSIKNIVKGNSAYILQYRDNLKQTRPGKNNSVVDLKAYPADRRLCPVTVLREYLNRTEEIRNNNTDLFISYIKPHNSVTKNTVSRWLKTVMSKAGIDVKKYCVHSIRSASASKAKSSLVPMDDILNSVGWSNARTFAKYYDKKIEKSSSFQSAVLK